MLKIIPDARVLEALSAVFPKPPNSARRASEKYCDTLSNAIATSLVYDLNPYRNIPNLYSVSLHNLANTGGQIGTNKIRLHSWLEQNNLSLINVVDLGNNIAGRNSLVKLSNNASIEDSDLLQNARASPNSDINELIDSLIELDNPAVNDVISTYIALPKNKTNEYDLCIIDKVSLKNFVKDIISNKLKLPKAKEDNLYRRSLFILRIANKLDNCLPQLKIKSEFGRTYYQGISIQNVHKDLRKAMLGNAWEYDVKTSVFTWKFGFAKEWIALNKQDKTVDSCFPATALYIESKDDFIAHTSTSIYGQVEGSNYFNLVKQALTAIGFGARGNASWWIDKYGNQHQSALKEIFTDTDDCDKFLNTEIVKQFIVEQKLLDEFICNKFVLKSYSKFRINKSKVLAFLYQQAETIVMDNVRKDLAKLKIQVLANIHDAIVVRQRIPNNELIKIQNKIRKITGLTHWTLGETQYFAC
jgi:hypothetical protein